MEAIDMVDLLYEKRVRSRVVGMRIREKWVQRNQLVIAQPSWLGWVASKANTANIRDTVEDFEALELETLKELGRI